MRSLSFLSRRRISWWQEDMPRRRSNDSYVLCHLLLWFYSQGSSWCFPCRGHFWGCWLVNCITFSSYLSDCIALWASQHCNIWILFFAHWISPLYVLPIKTSIGFMKISLSIQNYNITFFTGLKKKGGGLAE